MRRHAWIGASALAAVLVLAAPGCASGNKAGGASEKRTTELTLASQWISGQPVQLTSFANQVAKLSGGTMRIEFRDNWRAGDRDQEVDTIEDVRAGTADLGWEGARAWDWLGIHNFDPLIAPLLINSYPLERRVFASGLPQKMLVGVQRAGVVGVGVLPGWMGKLLGFQQRLLTPADFRGLSFGVRGPLAASTLRALGARPELYFANEPLNRLGGLDSQLLTIANYNLDTAKSYLGGNLNLWPRPSVLFASPKIFHALSATQQHVLREAAKAAVMPAMNGAEQDDVTAKQVLCARHKLTFITLTPAQLRAMARVVAPVNEQLSRNTATGRAITEIQALKRGLPPPPTITCPRRPASTSTAPTPIDGTWQMTVTASQLRGNPAYKIYGYPNPPPNEYKADSGTYRFSFHRGHMQSSLVSSLGTTSRDTGTFRLRDHLVIIHNTAGHDIAETDTYVWSLYHGELTLTKPPHQPNGHGGPPNPTFAPWHRVRR
jgi:TRAP-type C4-dicarboxylate transport system substrate-binding protein